MQGVVISTPNLLEPGQDWELRTRDQPIKLLFQNADTNGVRPLKYSFDVAADAAFKNIVFARTGVEPDAAGVTQFQLPDRLAAGTYWWRTRAEDGANTGPYSETKSFNVLAEVVLAPPIPSTPNNGALLIDITPDFRVKAGDAERGHGRDRIHRPGREQLVVLVDRRDLHDEGIVARDAHRQRLRVPSRQNVLLACPRVAYGRRLGIQQLVAHADLQDAEASCCPAAAAPAPGDDDDGGGGGGGGGSNPGRAIAARARDIADCIEARYPPYLAAGVSLSARKANMAFLRDRMIEHGKCKGLDLGLNLKRGGPTISNDFLVWRRPGKPDMGVDIGSAYDDTGTSTGTRVAHVRSAQLRASVSTSLTGRRTATDTHFV